MMLRPTIITTIADLELDRYCTLFTRYSGWDDFPTEKAKARMGQWLAIKAKNRKNEEFTEEETTLIRNAWLLV